LKALGPVDWAWMALTQMVYSEVLPTSKFVLKRSLRRERSCSQTAATFWARVRESLSLLQVTMKFLVSATISYGPKKFGIYPSG
jgi:hypothetical protein